MQLDTELIFIFLYDVKRLVQEIECFLVIMETKPCGFWFLRETLACLLRMNTFYEPTPYKEKLIKLNLNTGCKDYPK